MRALLLPGLFFLLVVSTLLAAGCGGGGDGGETLEIADIGWTENIAISVLTKVLLEEELGSIPSSKSASLSVSWSRSVASM